MPHCANGTAIAGSDYTATSGILTFNPGETSKQVKVKVTRDRIAEADETFTLNLSNASNATLSVMIVRSRTILNDDASRTRFSKTKANQDALTGVAKTQSMEVEDTLLSLGESNSALFNRQPSSLFSDLKFETLNSISSQTAVGIGGQGEAYGLGMSNHGLDTVNALGLCCGPLDTAS